MQGEEIPLLLARTMGSSRHATRDSLIFVQWLATPVTYGIFY